MGLSFVSILHSWKVDMLAGTNYVQWQPYAAAGVNATFRFVIKAQREIQKRPITSA